MDDIDFLEFGGAGPQPFRVIVDGTSVALADPRQMHFQLILLALREKHAPGTPSMPDWKRELTFERWRVAWDLPSFSDARRLAYAVDKYRAAISHDLMAGPRLDLGALWRERRWTLLLDVIDRLPAHSWYNAGVAMDEEYARMLVASIKARQAEGKDEKSSGPSLTTWTPEVAALNNVLDATRYVAHAVVAAQHGSKAGEPPKPVARPVTAIERAMKRAEYDRRKSAHEALVARVLPHKAKK